MGESIYMLPSGMNLTSGTVGNNKILVSDGMFCLGKNDEVNTSASIHRAPIVRTPNQLIQDLLHPADSGPSSSANQMALIFKLR